jgi:hypothetical protein
VLDGDPRKPTVLAYDVITIPQSVPQSAALSAIRTHLAHVIAKHQPDEVAVEGIIYVQSHRTAITMGAARAAARMAHGRRRGWTESTRVKRLAQRERVKARSTRCQSPKCISFAVARAQRCVSYALCARRTCAE